MESPARASPLSAIDGAGVDFISVKESYLDTSGPFRDVLLAFAATVARMERDRLIERTKAGLARARAQVRVGGRPRNLPLVEAAACVHNDLAEKFVRANVISYDDFVACGYSEKEAKARGLNRTEGKTYVVKDADIVHILASS